MRIVLNFEHYTEFKSVLQIVVIYIAKFSKLYIFIYDCRDKHTILFDSI